MESSKDLKDKHFDIDIIKNQSWLRRHALELFVANLSLLQFFHMSYVVYYIGVVRTIEKRYGLASASTGMVMSLNDVIHIAVVIFVGYFGRKGHKPLIIGSTSIFLFISALLFASPYFLYGAEVQEIISQESSFEPQHCGSQNTTDDCSDLGESQRVYTTNSVFYILCVANVLGGIGGCALSTLGMAYVDQNSDKTKSALYLAIISSTFSLGPIGGIVLAAFCTKMPEDLQETDKTPEDPTWIGAWWLGYVICAVFLFIFTLPIFFFPKHIKPPSEQKTPKTKHDESSFLAQMKEFPKATRDLMKNTAFLCLLITGICSVYVITGVFINMPRFFEIHYHLPAFKANIGTALPGAAGMVGGLIGGALMTKFQFDVVDSTKMVIFSLAITALGIGTAMFITCPQINMAGDWNADLSSVSLDQTCNTNCECDLSKNTLHYVCAPDGLTHYSPCYAGCASEDSFTNDGATFYANCTCIEGTAKSGSCEESCISQFYIFSFIMLVMSFLSSLGRIPGIVVQLRIVGEDEGSYALSISSFTTNLLGFIPGPILFGYLVDSTCVLWQYNCDRRGACLFYDTNSFRYKIFGFSLIFEVLAVICGFILLWAVKKKTAKERDLGEYDKTLIRDPGDRTSLLTETVSSL